MFRASHLIGTGDYNSKSRNLRAQSCEVKLIFETLLCEEVQGDRVKSNTCSYQRQSDKTSQILKMRPKSGGGGAAGQQQQTRGDKNLNLINNNRSRWGSINAWYIIQKITNMRPKCKNWREKDLWWWNLVEMRRGRRNVAIVINIVSSWYHHQILLFLAGTRRERKSRASDGAFIHRTSCPGSVVILICVFMYFCICVFVPFWFVYICIFNQPHNTCHNIPV